MTTEATLNGLSGREASMARRKALSQGKASLGPASERVRSGFREAAMPSLPQAQVVPGSVPAVELSDVPPPTSLLENSTAGFASGREASMARRRALSLGKSGLPPAAERIRSGFRDAAMPDQHSAIIAPALDEPTAVIEPPAPIAGCSGREAAMKHRMIRARFGRGDAPESAPCRPARKGELNYPAKVPSVVTAVSNATVTGLSYAAGRAMTGAEAGRDKPLTGTQYVGGAEGGYRASSGKVGHAQTDGGQTVSGTMVRSTVKITGDEDSSDVRITGNADQTLSDDLNARGEAFVPVGAQFQRQSQPHGQSVHGTNLGRSARAVGSRSRDTERPVEQTDGGHAVSGTAIGRSARVTGDEPGAIRNLTGTQYLAPAAAQAVFAPENGRADPASGGKVSQSQTWAGQTVTGPKMEHDDRVTGSEHGSCAPMTGTPYYGASGAHEWCDPATAQAEETRRGVQKSRAITGDVPLNDPMVSGTSRGAERDITGSSYFVADEAIAADAEGDRVVTSINGFSVSSPQRASHLKARRETPAPAEAAASNITGTFAQGDGKITGNVEFSTRIRSAQGGLDPARRAVTGEGAVKGQTITGSAWSEDSRVTGTEDYIATSRNPSERAGGSHGFAGANRFKSKAADKIQSSPVTGAVGWTPKSGAAVTLSGGAAG